MQYILDLLLKQIFGQPFLLMAIIVFIGYIAMKQKFSKALMGAVKASIGILVMGMGSGALIGNFGKLLTLSLIHIWNRILDYQVMIRLKQQSTLYTKK